MFFFHRRIFFNATNTYNLTIYTYILITVTGLTLVCMISYKNIIPTFKVRNFAFFFDRVEFKCLMHSIGSKNV